MDLPEVGGSGAAGAACLSNHSYNVDLGEGVLSKNSTGHPPRVAMAGMSGRGRGGFFFNRYSVSRLSVSSADEDYGVMFTLTVALGEKPHPVLTFVHPRRPLSFPLPVSASKSKTPMLMPRHREGAMPMSRVSNMYVQASLETGSTEYKEQWFQELPTRGLGQLEMDAGPLWCPPCCFRTLLFPSYEALDHILQSLRLPFQVTCNQVTGLKASLIPWQGYTGPLCL